MSTDDATGRAAEVSALVEHGYTVEEAHAALDKATTPTPDEICERLRSCFVMFAGKPHFSNKTKVHKAADLADAADLIQQQQAEIERLSAALEELVDGYRSEADPYSCGGFCRNLDEDDCMVTALAALGKDVSKK